MNPEIIERVFKDWFKEVSKEFPPAIAELAKPKIKSILLDLLTGKKSVDEAVNEIDVGLLERIIKSGSKPADFVKRSEIHLKIISSRLDESTLSEIIPIFTGFQAKFLQKLMKVYEEILEGEIAERKRVERALRVLSRVNQAVLQAEDEKSLLENVCRIVVDEGYVYSWIGYAEANKTVKLMASAGLNGYAGKIKVTWDESETGRGPTGTAIRTKKPTISKNLEADKAFEPWREEALKRGYASSIALPLIYKDRVFGALKIYSKEENTFDDEETELLREVAENLAYGIAMLREKKEKERIEELYRIIIENTGTGIILVGRDGKIIFVNDEMLKKTGFPKEELIGRHFTELIAEDEREKVLANFKLRLIDPESAPRSYEVKCIDARGEIRHGLVMVTLFDEQFIISFIDVTELKEMGRMLRESESRYRTIFNVSPLPIILAGVDTTILDCNDATLKLINRGRDEVIGKKWTELGIFDEKDLPLIMELFYKRLREGGKQKLEPFEIKIKVDDAGDIKEKWLNVFSAPLEVAGRPYAFLSIIEDITERKLNEKRLKDALEQLKILRSVDLGIIEGKSIEEVVGEITEALKQKIGCDLVCISALEMDLSVENICSLLKDRRKIEDLKKREEKGIVRVESIAKLDNLFEIEVELLKAGMKRYILIPLIARDEEVGVLLIVSKKRMSEESIYFMRQIAGQLAIALHEAILYKMRRKAFKQIEQNIEEFAILVDHIRNPLAIILGTAELQIDDEEVRKIIEDAVDKIEDTITRLDMGWLKSEEVRNFLKRY